MIATPQTLRETAEDIESGRRVPIGTWVLCGQACRQAFCAPVTFDFKTPDGKAKAVADLRRAAALLESSTAGSRA